MSQQQQGSATEDPNEEPNIGLELSGEMVRVFKDQFGRGPTRARSHWAGPDTIVVILEDTLTPAERSLVRLGEHQRLRDLRTFFQYASVRRLCEPVERLTGRKVQAFFSQIDPVAEGMAVETFVLHPPGYDGPSRIEIGDREDEKRTRRSPDAGPARAGPG